MNTQEVPDWMIDATNIPKAEALQTLEHRLPEGWNIQIDIERGAGSVTLFAPEDTMYEIDSGGESIEADMLEALRFACWREKQTELVVDRAWAQFKTAMRFNARDEGCASIPLDQPVLPKQTTKAQHEIA